MVTLSALWLPIVLSAVIVFVASNILWMALPFWHRRDYGKLPDENAVLSGLTSASSGQYVVPSVNWSKLTPEERADMQKKPMAFVILRNPATFSFPQALVSYLVYTLVMSTLIAYVGAHALPRGAYYLRVFQIVGTAGILTYAFGSVSESIWYGKPWAVTFRQIVDGIIYGLLTAGTFGWLWPR